jgi:hypothetical protein
MSAKEETAAAATEEAKVRCARRGQIAAATAAATA